MGRETAKHLMQHAFTTGEMSPLTLGRQDVAKYLSGAQVLENFQVTPQGAILNDTGTVFVNSTKLSATPARLLKFVFSNSQAYILELGNLYARFYTLGGQIQSGGSAVEVVTPYLASELNAIKYTQSGDYIYLTHINHPPAAIIRGTSNTAWTYKVLAFEDGPYQNENLDPTKTITASALAGSVTLTANYNAFVAGNVGACVRLNESTTTVYQQWQSGVCYNTGALVTNAGYVYSCTNGGNSLIPNWTTATAYTGPNAVISNGQLYVVTSGGTTTGSTGPAFIGGSAAVGGVTWQWVATMNNLQSNPLGEWQNGVSYPIGYFVYWGTNVYVCCSGGTSGGTPPTQMIGTWFSDGGADWIYLGKKSGITAPIQDAGTQSDGNLSWAFLHAGFGTAVITAYTSPTAVTATVTSNSLPNGTTGGTINFWLGAWDAFNGYPSVVCFYEQRLCFMGTPNFPADVWMSNTDDYYNMAPTTTGTNVTDTNSIHITLASGDVNVIEWALPTTRLIIGTQGTEWQVWQANTSEGFSPSNIQSKRMSSLGSAPIVATQINQSILYCHRSEKRFYEATYNYLYDLYQSVEMNYLADHILREGGGVVDVALQQDPYSVLWVLRADGVLVGLTYYNDQQITAWHRHVLDGNIISIACIPNPQTNSDQLWMIVERTINGQTVYYVEYVQAPFYPTSPTDLSAMWYVECGSSLQGAVTQVTGLGYLQGETVVAVVDGAVQPPQVVPSNGTIQLQTASVNQVVVGLPMQATITVLPPDFEGQKGTIQGQVKRTNKLKLRLWRSLGCSAYSNDQPTPNPLPIESFRSTGAAMNAPPPLFTGDWPLVLAQGASPDGVFTVAQTQPYPLNILGLITDTTGYEA